MSKLQNRDELRRQFAALLANGETVKSASAAIGISARLGRKWGRELDEGIATKTREADAMIYDQYGIRRGQRIERIAKTTQAVLDASEMIDFEALAKDKPEKLLELVLRFNEAASNNEPAQDMTPDLQTAQGALDAIEALYRRVMTGETSKAQAEIELKVIGAALQGIEAAKTESRIAELESMVRALEENTAQFA